MLKCHRIQYSTKRSLCGLEVKNATVRHFELDRSGVRWGFSDGTTNVVHSENPGIARIEGKNANDIGS